MAKWYVVQVPSGREEYLCRLIKRTVAEVLQREHAEGMGDAMPADEKRPALQGKAPKEGALRKDALAGEKALLEECFVPTCEFERKRRGEWHKVQLPLFPGYVVAVTDDVAQLEVLLRRVPEFTRVLRMGESFTPLDDAERTWITTYAGNKERSVPMSYAVAEGDAVRIVSGPLVGCEGQIAEIKRRQGVAILEVHMFGRTMRTRVGLAIVTKREEQQRGGNAATGSS